MNDGFLPGLLIGAIIGAIIFVGITNNSWKNSVIEHNCAYYDQKTAEFTWSIEND